MISQIFIESTDTVHKFDRLAKVREAVTLLKMVLINDPPTLQLRRKFGYLVGTEGRHAATARNTLFACEFTHENALLTHLRGYPFKFASIAFFKIAICPA